MTALPPGTGDLIRRALDEDLGVAGDITSAATIPAGAEACAVIVGREPGRVSGLGAALRVFQIVDPRLEIATHLDDGHDVEPGEAIATIAGPTRSILAAERVALNLLGHLSGVATATRMLVGLVEGTGVRISDTRKTTPGLRALQKQAVRHGGGTNHRFGLHDAVMIKDNHVAAVGSIIAAVERARNAVGHMVVIEVEADTLEQAVEAADAGADVVLLDNMDPSTVRAAVVAIDGRAVVEASGGITGETIRPVASSGVDVISVGWLTHSAPSLDVALDLTPR